MSGLVLRLRQRPPRPLDLSAVLPERLEGLESAAVAALRLGEDLDAPTAGDVFELSSGGEADLTLVDACDQLDWIGRGAKTGTILVEGDVGLHAGAELAGGTLRIRGSAGPGAAGGMSAGLLQIEGNAGPGVGGPSTGATLGMRGGTVIVGGRIGDRAGDRMRRGMIVALGDAGAYLGSRMVAGTIIASGGVGPFAGFAMKRGTLLLRRPPALLPTFADDGPHDLGFIHLLRRSLIRLGLDLGGWPGARARRFAGDAAVGGKGEILVAEG